MLLPSADRAPYSAPQTASASADINVLMNVVSICRSRSGLAWASCSDRKRAGSILLGAVIASFLLGSCERSSRRSRGGRLHVRATLVTEPVAHHLGGRHSALRRLMGGRSRQARCRAGPNS